MTQDQHPGDTPADPTPAQLTTDGATNPRCSGDSRRAFDAWVEREAKKLGLTVTELLLAVDQQLS